MTSDQSMPTHGGLAGSAGDPTAISAFASFAHRILRIAPGAEKILEVRKQMPDEPVLNLGEALFWLFGQTAGAFDKARPRLTEIGGSDAQDDLFRFAHITSLAASGRQADARELLASRLASKTPSPMEERWMQKLAL
jgi:hypothetical protein